MFQLTSAMDFGPGEEKFKIEREREREREREVAPHIHCFVVLCQIFVKSMCMACKI